MNGSSHLSSANHYLTLQSDPIHSIVNARGLQFTSRKFSYSVLGLCNDGTRQHVTSVTIRREKNSSLFTHFNRLTRQHSPKIFHPASNKLLTSLEFKFI